MPLKKSTVEDLMENLDPQKLLYGAKTAAWQSSIGTAKLAKHNLKEIQAIVCSRCQGFRLHPNGNMPCDKCKGTGWEP